MVLLEKVEIEDSGLVGITNEGSRIPLVREMPKPEIKIFTSTQKVYNCARLVDELRARPSYYLCTSNLLDRELEDYPVVLFYQEFKPRA